jgi:hypothetical protein
MRKIQAGDTVVWMKAKPKGAGAYWMKEPDGSKKLVYIGRTEPRYLTIGTRSYALSGAAFDSCEWYGPLAPPPG